MGLKNFEYSLEKLVDGFVYRAFKSELQPEEIGKLLLKEVDAQRQIDESGEELIPNEFAIRISSDDYGHLQEEIGSITSNLSVQVRAFVRDQGLLLPGKLRIVLIQDPEINLGLCEIDSSFDASLNPEDDSHCILETLDGIYYQLKNRIMTIGRVEESDIVIEDDNISRHHAELHPVGDTFELVDLHSTNGSMVNGKKIKSILLFDGDELTFGPAKLWFKQT